MIDQNEFLIVITQKLSAAGIPYMITGSSATNFLGQPRATNNVDIVIAPTSEQLDAFVTDSTLST